MKWYNLTMKPTTESLTKNDQIEIPTDHSVSENHKDTLTNAHFIYVLLCADQTLYCGYTTDVEKRISTHNSGKGAKYTKTRLPVQLLTSLSFDTKTEAMQCEWWFKNKLQRKQKLELIKSRQIKEKFQDYQKTRQN